MRSTSVKSFAATATLLATLTLTVAMPAAAAVQRAPRRDAAPTSIDRDGGLIGLIQRLVRNLVHAKEAQPIPPIPAEEKK
ncbi:MAG: hypothetical protein JO197_11130 [Acidobacteria bacterium]|nr:hypothetical protein [Acidobacteriota bacterium]MBV9476028.1 hypothetical protein [Acidobacteriota bacterium]